MRDMGLFDVSLSILEDATQYLDLTSEGSRARVETIRLTITARKALSLSTEALGAAVDAAAAALAEEMRVRGELAPGLTLLAQLATAAERRGLVLDPNVRRTLAEAYDASSAIVAERARLLGSRNISMPELAAHLAALSGTRAPDDLAYDANEIAMLARRAMKDDQLPPAIFSAIELLADQRLSSTARTAIADAAATASAIVQSGYSIHMLALDDDDILVHAYQERGIRIARTG